jgi:hypothetical protein
MCSSVSAMLRMAVMVSAVRAARPHVVRIGTVRFFASAFR